MDDQSTRIIRIEEKLDKVSEAIISLARMEEKMITLFNRMDTYDKKQGSIEERVIDIEVKHASGVWVEIFSWLVIGGLITLVLYLGK